MTGARVQELTYQKAVVAACALVFAATLFTDVLIVAIRIAALLVLVGQVWLEVRGRSNLYLASPPFLLAAIALILFSFIQGVMGAYPVGSYRPEILAYIGSDAERVIVAFAVVGIAVHGFVCHFAGRVSARGGGEFIHANKMAVFIAAASVALILVRIAVYKIDPAGGAIGGGIRTIASPLLAFMMIYLIGWASKGGTQNLIIAALVCAASIAGLLYVHEGKDPVFMVLAGWLYWLRVRNVPIRKVLASGLVFIFLGIALIQTAQIIRLPHDSVIGTATKYGNMQNLFYRTLLSKAVWRQTETGYCLNNLIDAHRDQSLQASKQLFWLQGLVPRILWPEKPNLSLGWEYAARYCNLPKPKVISPTGKHSASITLLGQPIIQGGWVGLLLHGGLVLAGLGSLTWAARRPEGLPTMVIAALLPWWIDFDQDFVLYVANLVKFFLIMLPMIFIVGFIGNNRKDETG